jgi:ATP-dependent RNA helicase DeaD
VDHLEAAGYMADRLHGDMTQNMRDRVMNKFRKSGLEFLVATDIAARGIDVDDVEVVFNYDLPYDGEDYVHRIGRTGRVGRSGRAITFVSGRELFQIRNIERYTNTRIHRGRPPTVSEVEEAKENAFLGKLRATLQSGEFKRQDQLVERLLEEGFTSTDIASACLAQLQSGEAASKPASRTEVYERPERTERGGFRDDRRARFEDRRSPRYESRERFERPRRIEDRPPRAEKRPATAVPVSAPSRPAKTETPPAITPSAEIKSTVETVSPVETRAAAEKTYSDAEILASVKPPEAVEPKPVAHKNAPPWANKKREADRPAAKGKPSRATPPDQTRLWMNLGEAMDIKPIDIVNAVAGETGLPGKVVGTVDVRERHLFVDVASEHANSIIAKLNRSQIKGHKVKVKVA